MGGCSGNGPAGQAGGQAQGVLGLRSVAEEDQRVNWKHLQGLCPRGPPPQASMVVASAVLRGKGTSPAVPEKPHASSCSEVDRCLLVLL